MTAANSDIHNSKSSNQPPKDSVTEVSQHAEDELSDAQLDHVAGGKKNKDGTQKGWLQAAVGNAMSPG